MEAATGRTTIGDKMSVYKKLMKVRLAFHKMELKKSGINKFAGYTYFELSDFIPIAQSLFAEHGLCGVVSYSQDIATLTITDVDAPEHSIAITSPMAEANLKGCHPIQNLGAVETYTRRYLWVTALELVEHDILDASEPIKEVKGATHKPADNQDFKPDEEELKHLQGILDNILSLDTDYEAISIYIQTQKMDADEKTWVWNKLDSKTRSGIKAVNQKESK